MSPVNEPLPGYRPADRAIGKTICVEIPKALHDPLGPPRELRLVEIPVRGLPAFFLGLTDGKTFALIAKLPAQDVR